jgi:NADH pyrophosphatase NudC (nudix superfamily)
VHISRYSTKNISDFVTIIKSISALCAGESWARGIEMIEKIYKNKYMATCDNCGTGQECDNWTDVMDFMNEEGWKKMLVDGEWKHYCSECREGLE